MTQQQVIEADGGKCVYCGGPAVQLDHVIPVSRGGLDVFGNLVGVCIPCNSKKGAGGPLGPLPARCSVDSPDYGVEVVLRRRGSRPTKEAKRLQMARYRARYPAKMREYWRRYKAAKRAEARDIVSEELS